jgi:hypothetical protein
MDTNFLLDELLWSSSSFIFRGVLDATFVLDSSAELEVYSLITFIRPSVANTELLKALLTLASLIVALYMSLKRNRKESLEM